MMAVGRSVTGFQASPEGPASTEAAAGPPVRVVRPSIWAVCTSLPDGGSRRGPTRRSGAPSSVRPEPARSASVRVAGALPVLAMVSSWVALLPRTAVASIGSVVRDSRPAVSFHAEVTAVSARAATVLVRSV